MGLLDKFKQGAKDITGIGLDAVEQYNRAYQKGVFLQPPNYQDAIGNFEKAAEKFGKDGNDDMAKRSIANAALYKLVLTGDKAQIPAVLHALGGVGEIERIGNQQEMLPVGPLVIELTALQGEVEAEEATTHELKSVGFKKASDELMKIGTAELQFAQRLKLDGPTDKGIRRAFYYMGLSSYNGALAIIEESPDDSENHLQKAVNAFKQAQESDWEKRVSVFVEDVQTHRHCWMCGREVQGRNIFFKHYPSRVDKYFHHLVTKLKQDEKMLEQPNAVTLCTACGHAIEKQADAYAIMRTKELKEWVEPILQNHEHRLAEHAAAIEQCMGAIRQLQAASHRHSG